MNRVTIFSFTGLFIHTYTYLPSLLVYYTPTARCKRIVGAHYLESDSWDKMADGGAPGAVPGTGGGGGEGGGGGLGERETWELFSNWVCCVCVVTFDLELGQALEVNYRISCIIYGLYFM